MMSRRTQIENFLMRGKNNIRIFNSNVLFGLMFENLIREDFRERLDILFIDGVIFLCDGSETGLFKSGLLFICFQEILKTDLNILKKYFLVTPN